MADYSGTGRSRPRPAAHLTDDEDGDEEEHDRPEGPDLVDQRVRAESAGGQGRRRCRQPDGRLGPAAGCT